MIRQVAEYAWLIEFDERDAVAANARARTLALDLSSARLPGLVDVVPAARSVLVSGSALLDLAAVNAAVERLPAVIADLDTGAHHVIGVVFDGADLDESASLAGLTREGLVLALTSIDFTVGFLGFVPGFAYLLGLPPELHLPRRRSPRARVPIGAVALAGAYAGIYPGGSPGGWNLIGCAHVRLFEALRSPAALLQPGDRVRFAAHERHT